jgi:hypothetical protein
VYSRRWDTTTTDPLKLLLAWPKQDPLPGTYPRVPASSLPVCFDRYGPSPLFPGPILWIDMEPAQLPALNSPPLLAPKALTFGRRY